MQQKLYRNHAMTFRVTKQERDMINQRLKMSGMINMRGYLLKMALEGRIIRVELDSVNEMNRLLGNISNNINQIARRVNQTGRIYNNDFEEIRDYLDKIWVQQNEILQLLDEVLEVV